jgi:acetyl-CoA synthase
MAYALLGVGVKSIKDARAVLEHAKSLLPEEPSSNLWLPYLGNALDAGIATLLAEEIIMALRYLYGQEPQKDCNGFFTDTIMRSLGIQLVDGRMPGFAAVLGAAPDNQTAVEIVRQLQERNILIFVGSNVAGRSIIDQLIEENVQMGWENYIVPYGRDTLSVIYPLNWAIRSALTFGGLKAGQAKKCLLYTKERVFAFGLVLGEVDDLKYATGTGAINMGFPIIADTRIPEIKPSGITTYEALVRELDHKKIVARAIEVRGVKVTVTQIPIPVSYAAAFEGERVRREQLYVEFGGKATTAFEYLTSKDSGEVEDGKVELIGPDIDQLPKGKKSMPLAIIVEVAGRKMQKDFEPVLERQIHRYTNYAMGIMHIGQRDMCWIRISQQAYSKGVRLKHFGIFLHAMFHKEYGAIVDKVQVKLYTRQSDVERLLTEVKKVYNERDERISGMTDESVDTFYSCTLCQSFAPNHVCIVTPERLGLCGAYSWLDAKACYEITPTGPNQPITKGNVLDQKFGQWENVNRFVYEKSNKAVNKVSMYSLMDSPQTSCVTTDTQVIIDNKVSSIGEFIDKNRGSEEYAKSMALTLNKGKSTLERIVALQRFELPKERRNLLKINTKSGNEILLTSNHAIAIDRPEGIMWVEASQIKKGDRVISLKRLELTEKIPDIYDLIPGDFRLRDENLIKEVKQSLIAKYGSLSKALKKLSLRYFCNDSICLSEFKIILKDLGKDWNEIKGEISKFGTNGSSITISNSQIDKDLFYLMGLIATDGSIFKRGNYEYNIYFINTQRELVNIYRNLYKKVFPQKKLNISFKSPNKKSFIKGRKVNSVKNCYVCYSNNSIFGILLDHFGITTGLKGKRNFKNLLNLPKEYIASFLTGLFDGDGSARIRKYKNLWDTAEVYLCTQSKFCAHYLQWLLKRFSILSNVRKSNSIYKIVMHGSNAYEFSRLINPVHKIKARIIKEIRAVYAKKELDKTQTQVLPFFAGKILTDIAESKSILSPTTLFYYKTFRSRPISGNIQKVIAQSDCKEAENLKSLLKSDFYLDIVKEVKQIKTKRKFVYNLTLSDTHCYFANQMLIKNCGCFECIVAIIPEANGFMVVHRDYSGMTPCGMTFTGLAGSVGGGVQTPGFLGIGRLYILSKKFISADGGLARIVWMPKELKENLGEKLKQRCEEIGHPALVDKIADETQATTSEQLLEFLSKVGHPALSMPPLL